MYVVRALLRWLILGPIRLLMPPLGSALIDSPVGAMADSPTRFPTMGGLVASLSDCLFVDALGGSLIRPLNYRFDRRLMGGSAHGFIRASKGSVTGK